MAHTMVYSIDSYMTQNLLKLLVLVIHSCVDPESFVRGDPTLITFFKLMRGEMIQKPLKAGHRRPPAKCYLFKWRFAGVQMMAQH